MTTLYIRHPAKASVDGAAGGEAPPCQYALAADDGALRQQGSAALGSLGALVGAARRVVLLLAAADVTLLRVSVPPLSPARLKAALPNLVEEQILGDPADCVLAAGAPDQAGLRTVAVAQRAWVEALVKALLAQGARSVAALPAQLCLPLRPERVSAALGVDGAGLELTLRLGPHEGIGLALPAQPLAALQTLRACAGAAAVTLYLPPALHEACRALDGAVPGIELAPEQWSDWIAAAGAAAPDLVPALGAAGGRATDWRRWRWPLRLALLTLLLNVGALNLEWLGWRRDADLLRAAILQSFRAAYPNQTVLDPLAQMRRNVAGAGQAAGDDFEALGAALAEALGGRAPIAELSYRERALSVKFKAGAPDPGLAQARAALAARQLQLAETAPGVWQIRAGAAAPNRTGGQ